MWRRYLIEWPALVLDGVWLLYLGLVGTLAILCFTTVALMLLAYLLGYRLFW